MASVNVRSRMAPRPPTTFRPPAYTPTTAWGRHLVEFRRARNWSLTYAFEQWAEGLGMSLRSRTAYRLIEQGKREPNARERAFLVSVVGEPSEIAPDLAPATETGGDLAALVRALNAQTEAINGLLARFDSLAVDAIRRGVDAAVAEAAALRAGEGSRPEPPAQQLG